MPDDFCYLPALVGLTLGQCSIVAEAGRRLQGKSHNVTARLVWRLFAAWGLNVESLSAAARVGVDWVRLAVINLN